MLEHLQKNGLSEIVLIFPNAVSEDVGDITLYVVEG